MRKTKTITIGLMPTQYKAVTARAAREEKSVSEILREALAAYKQKDEAKASPPPDPVSR